MDWTVFVSLFVPIVSGIISYLAAINKSKTDIENSRIQANNEIEKIRENAEAEIKKVAETAEIENRRMEEQYKHDLEKLKTETDERIRLMIAEKDLQNKTKNDEMANQFAARAFNNPKEMVSNLEAMGELMGGLADLQKEMGRLGFSKDDNTPS